MNTLAPVRHAALSWLYVSVLLVQGCASYTDLVDRTHPSIHKDIDNKLTASERKEISTIVIFVPDTEVSVDLKGFRSGGKGKGAARDAGSGALEGALFGIEASLLNPIAAIAAFVIAVPAGFIAGGVEGAITTQPTGVMATAEATAQNTIHDMNPEERLQQHVQQLAGQNPPSSLRYRYTEFNIGGSTTFTALADAGIDAVLGITIKEVGTRDARVDTSFFSSDVVDVRIKTYVRLIRVRDKGVVFAGTYSFCSKPSKRKGFTDWTEDNGLPLREEIMFGLGEIAKAVISDLFPAHIGRLK